LRFEVATHPFELKEAQELPIGPVELRNGLGEGKVIRATNEGRPPDDELQAT
jgi:hypothetical protein